MGFNSGFKGLNKIGSVWMT